MISIVPHILSFVRSRDVLVPNGCLQHPDNRPSASLPLPIEGCSIALPTARDPPPASTRFLYHFLIPFYYFPWNIY